MRAGGIRSALLVLAIAVACRSEENAASKRTAGPPEEGGVTSVPMGREPTGEEIEQQRFSEQWRNIPSFQQRTPIAPAPVATTAPLRFIADTGFEETLEDIEPVTIMQRPLRVPIKGDVSGPSLLRAQILLDRSGFSVGSIDGRWGQNSEIAAFWFQRENGLNATGDIDEPTFRALFARGGAAPLLTRYSVSADDLTGPFRAIPEGVYEQEKLDCLCFSSPGEKLAEKFHGSLGLLELLNPNVAFDTLQAGQTLNVAAIGADVEATDVARILISVEGNYLHGLDVAGAIRFHAPTTVGSKYDPSPNETLALTSIASNPQFRYQPRLFSEVPDTNPEAQLKAGPNSPVGVVWMALSKPHDGIHGTSEPETIGYASSHGCVRLTNWDAHEIAHRTAIGMPVAFVDPRPSPQGGH